MRRRTPRSTPTNTLFPYTTLIRSTLISFTYGEWERHAAIGTCDGGGTVAGGDRPGGGARERHRRRDRSPRSLARGEQPGRDHRRCDRGAHRRAAGADDDRAEIGRAHV